LSPKLRKQHKFDKNDKIDKTNKIKCEQNQSYKFSLRLHETSTSKE